jgi:hypothetical protein|tara:strand:- start:1988 stop:2434 length:447 start_codon:yes stop_codon:yes gene_type:complete
MRKLIALNHDNWKRHILKDDPVRPHLDMDWKLEDGREVYAIEDQEINKMLSVVCIGFTKGPVITEAGLDKTVDDPDTAMFYTVWSYSKNAGRDVILAAAKLIKRDKPHIKRFVTLSPLTDVAERFHLRNGAVLLEKGDECQNFEYTLD